MSTLKTKVLKGFAWQGGGKLLERLVRFGVNILLARLLAPDDFGAFAALLLPLAAIDAVSYLASEPFIIHAKSGANPRFLSTAFTVNNIRGVLCAIGMLFIAPLFALYFDRPQLMPLFMLASIQPMLVGFESPGLYVLAKQLRFARIAIVRLGGALVGAVTALLWSLSDPSPLGLLVGQLVGVATATIGSWIVAPIWPAWGFDREVWSELRSFALKAVGTPLLIMLVNQAPALLLGRLDSLEALGIFSMNARLAELPVYLTLAVTGSVLIPTYSALQDDQDRLRRVWLKAWAGIAFLAVPLAVVFAWMGNALPQIVWGARYASDQPLMSILALCGLLSSLLAVTGPLFWGVGQPSIDRMMQAVRVVILFVCGVALTRAFQSEGLAWSLAIGLLAALLVACPSALKIVGGNYRQIGLASLPGVAAGAVMATPLVLADLVFSPQGWVRIVVAGGVVVLYGLLVGGKALNKRLDSQVST